MLDICPKNTITGLRDKAMMFFLLDTGVRASELLAINIEDINIVTGEILIRQGKGRKPRYVFIGLKTRKAVRNYLKFRKDLLPALWVSLEGERLSYWGLKFVMRSRANQANVNTPSLHSFRRWFALTCLRAGANVYSIQELMGHTDLQVLKRYLKQTNQDLMKAHQRANPIDSLF